MAHIWSRWQNKIYFAYFPQQLKFKCCETETATMLSINWVYVFFLKFHYILGTYMQRKQYDFILDILLL